MMIPCRIFSGRTAPGEYAAQFRTGDRGLVYVIDELALKSQYKHNDGYQHIDELTMSRTVKDVNGKDIKTTLLDLAFQENQGYGLNEFLDKFIKPVFLMENASYMTDLPTEPDSWENYIKLFRVWVNVQDGARTITTPAVGQPVYIGKRSDIPEAIRG